MAPGSDIQADLTIDRAVPRQLDNAFEGSTRTLNDSGGSVREVSRDSRVLE